MTTFTDTASRLAGLTALILGWRPEEFWRATPAELAGILRAASGTDGEGEGIDAAAVARMMEVWPDGRG